MFGGFAPSASFRLCAGALHELQNPPAFGLGLPVPLQEGIDIQVDAHRQVAALMDRQTVLHKVRVGEVKAPLAQEVQIGPSLPPVRRGTGGDPPHPQIREGHGLSAVCAAAAVGSVQGFPEGGVLYPAGVEDPGKNGNPHPAALRSKEAQRPAVIEALQQSAGIPLRAGAGAVDLPDTPVRVHQGNQGVAVVAVQDKFLGAELQLLIDGQQLPAQKVKELPSLMPLPGPEHDAELRVVLHADDGPVDVQDLQNHATVPEASDAEP